MPDPSVPADDAPAPLWPLAELEVQGLFGARDLRVALHDDATIFTGENGSGKSTVLKAVNLLAEGEWRALSELPLDGIRLEFRTGEWFAAQLGEGSVRVSQEDQDEWSLEWDPDSVPARRMRELDLVRNRIEAAAGAERQKLIARYNSMRRHMRHDEAEHLEIPGWLTDRVDRLQTKHVSARRLEHRLRPDEVRPGEDRPVSVVDRFAESLADRMRNELSAYAAESRRQEKVLPSQIVHAMQTAQTESAEDLATDVDQLVQRVRDLADSLTAVGLLYEEEDPDPQLAEYPRDDTSILLAVREVYRVTLERLERLSPLRAELELFTNFLNMRFTNKRIELNPQEGIAVVLDNGELIGPGQLSSGEQQLLALAYEILFQADAQSIVLLDEPELSLHVAWLKGLIAAFLEMGQERGLQFVIATHSPSVLAGHTNLERSLDDLLTHGPV